MVWEMKHSRLPPSAGTTAVSISFCGDEVMKPHSTSAYPGAINIAICDPGVTQRAKERTPPTVDTYTSWSLTITPARRSSTASTMATRDASTPLTMRRGLGAEVLIVSA